MLIIYNMEFLLF